MSWRVDKIKIKDRVTNKLVTLFFYANAGKTEWKTECTEGKMI